MELGNHTDARATPATCYRPMSTYSAGVWLGDNSLHHSVPLLLHQIIIISMTARITHALLSRLGIPLVISQIIGGILLGPSFLGRNKEYLDLFTAQKGWEQLNMLATLAYMLFIFMVGVKTDLGMIRKSGKKAVAISLIGSMTPYALVMIVGAATQGSLKKTELYAKSFFALVVASNWSLSSYVVLSCVLMELNLLTSKLGRVAMSASLVGEFFNQLSLAVLDSWVLGKKLQRPLLGVVSFMGFVVFVAFLLLVARPLVLQLVRRTPEGSMLDELHFVAVLMLAILCGLVSELMGLQVSLGPFLLGLSLPGGPPLGVTVVERLDRVISCVFLPLVLATAGLQVDLGFLAKFADLAVLEFYLIVSVFGKLLGVMLPCLYCKMPLRDAIAVALMMTSKGICEAISAEKWLNEGTNSKEVYSMVMMTIVVVGGCTAPLVKLLYRPEDRFVANKRRTIEHMKVNDELRVLACLHNQDHVGSILALLEGSYPTKEKPICIYALHLVQLIGRSATVLAPYKRRQKEASSSAAAAEAAATETDRIMNALRIGAERDADCVSILPYVCISPYSTMHDDICSLALDKKVFLIVLHFHHTVAMDGAIQTVNHAIQDMNLNVLRYSPCSVALLVDHGLRVGPLPDGYLQRVAVYFIGGPDCREALSCGKRLASHPAIGITLIRFRYDGDWLEDGGREEKQDEEVIADFHERFVDGHRVQSRVEVVRDGEATVAVMRAMSHHCSLLVVGRREGKESPITDGLSAWSEYPELGVMGDMLASTDFGGRLSTFVVQQQKRFVGGGGGNAERAESPKSVHRGSLVDPPPPSEKELGADLSV